jgi:hypothetical protein
MIDTEFDALVTDLKARLWELDHLTIPRLGLGTLQERKPSGEWQDITPSPATQFLLTQRAERTKPWTPQLLVEEPKRSSNEEFAAIFADLRKRFYDRECVLAAYLQPNRRLVGADGVELPWAEKAREYFDAKLKRQEQARAAIAA